MHTRQPDLLTRPSLTADRQALADIATFFRRRRQRPSGESVLNLHLTTPGSAQIAKQLAEREGAE